MTLTVRPLESTDQPSWRRLWTDYLTFYHSSVSEDVYQTTFERLLSSKENEYSCLVAVQDQSLIGLTHFLFHRHCWHIENVCYLQDLYVDPSVRGGGAGRALIEAVYAAADKAECPNVYWMTQSFNVAGQRLYDQLATKTSFIKYAR